MIAAGCNDDAIGGSEKGGGHGIRYWRFGRGSFSLCDCLSSETDIRKEENMEFVIGILVVVVLVFVVVYLVKRT